MTAVTPPDVRDVTVGDRALIDGGGSSPAWARVAGLDPARPHLAKVIYEHSGTAAWIARKRIRASYRPRTAR